MDTNDRARAIVDLDALRANLRLARDNSPHSRIAAVIKANAYGHGLLPVAAALDQADLLAVTDYSEARQLRAGGTDKPILILQGVMDRAEIREVAREGFQLVVHSLAQLAWIEDELADFTPPAPLTFWLKMDSGMGRLGLAPGDYAEAWRALAAKPYTRRVVMMTHLANASLPDAELTARQLESFDRVRHELGDAPTSIASSSGILADYGIFSRWARPGLMLYGSSPFGIDNDSLSAETLGLRPVMTLESRLIAVKQLAAGDNVGYCSQFVCPTSMRIGIASIGYADGYPSNAPNGTPVLVNGERSETVGRVSMDMLAVDLSHLPEAQVGDTVTLWGRGLAIDEVAAVTGIISYNLMCSVAPRVTMTHR